jgi:hypothetical protein
LGSLFSVLGKGIKSALGFGEGDFNLGNELSAIKFSPSRITDPTPISSTVPPKANTSYNANGVPSMLAAPTVNQDITINVPQGFTVPMAQDLVSKALGNQIGQAMVNYPSNK